VRVTDMVDLTPSWGRHLRATGAKPATITVYTRAVHMYAAHALSDAEVTRSSLVAFLAGLAERSSPSTVRVRFRSLSLFLDWCVAEGELPANPLHGLKPPAAAVPSTPTLTEDELTAMLKATKIERDEFHRRRAEAILRVFLDTGCRLSEVATIDLASVDLKTETLTVTGKGEKVRQVPVGTKCADALDRYLRARRKHPAAADEALWLGIRGRLGQDGVDRVLRILADRAGVDGFHAHRLRHTFAHRWLRAGGQERGLMIVAGWSSPDMLARYGTSLQVERAHDEARRLGLGEL
jgi:site-specific recombinase XerC